VKLIKPKTLDMLLISGEYSVVHVYKKMSIEQQAAHRGCRQPVSRALNNYILKKFMLFWFNLFG